MGTQGAHQYLSSEHLVGDQVRLQKKQANV